METIGWLLAGLNGVTLVAIGVTYGDARARLLNIEKQIDITNTRLTRLENRLWTTGE